MIRTFPNIRIGLMVGIGGGAPNRKHKIRLGDVVVSSPRGDKPGVFPYDHGKRIQDQDFIHTGVLDKPPQLMRTAVGQLKAQHQRKGHQLLAEIEHVLERNERLRNNYSRPPASSDRLYRSDIVHGTRVTAAIRPWPLLLVAALLLAPALLLPQILLLPARGRILVASVVTVAALSLVARERRHQGLPAQDSLDEDECSNICGSDPRHFATPPKRDGNDRDPAIHYGLIASSNQLMKDAVMRDELASKHDVLCFEMEAAGLMNHFPCLVIRGICDYSDSHKNKKWQGFAAMMAAAYAKDLLKQIVPSQVSAEKRIKEVLDAVGQKLDSIQQVSQATNAKVDHLNFDAQITKMEKWLAPADVSTNANRAAELRHPGTGKWLLGLSMFQEWCSGPRRYLWLHGLAGCGKTVLSATVLDQLATVDGRLILKFFFDFKDTAKQTFDSMLRALVFQAYQGQLASYQHPEGAPPESSDKPTPKTLMERLCKMLAAQPEVFIVLDALDESTTRPRLVVWIEEMLNKSELQHVRLIFTSRPESDFDRIYSLIGKENCLPLDKEGVNADICAYVTSTLKSDDRFVNKRLPADLIEKIRIGVGNGAEGMFRWAFCQLETLSICANLREVKDALEKLPRNLEETYERMIDSIPNERKKDAMRLLQFLVYCDRPLELGEAIDVIATQTDTESQGFDHERRPFDEAVTKHCPGMVAVVFTKGSTATPELHLAHFSVKEFLLKQPLFEITTASISITKTCLSYLKDIDDTHCEIEESFPLARRAAEMWMPHAVKAEVSEDIVKMSVEFLQDGETFRLWGELYHPNQDWEDSLGVPRGSRLYCTCAGGFKQAAICLLGKGADVNARGGLYGNALQAASRKGHTETARLLVDKGADINARGGVYDNALQAASREGHTETARLLVNKGADINARGGVYGNALQAASRGGHTEIARLLMDKGADVNAQGGFYGNALQAASRGGHTEIARLLLDKGADVNAQGGDYGNALQAASREGHTKIARLLLDKGADVNAQGGNYGNALQAASSEGRTEIARLLLDKGADVNAQGGNYGNALQAALSEGRTEIARLLLDKGADVNAQGGNYGNALQAASSEGHTEIARLLLDKGADVNAQGGRYGNALQTASSEGHTEIARLLLDKGADVNAQSGCYGNALQTASSKGHTEIARLLLDKGADVNAQGGFYGNALQAASSRGHTETAWLLLDKGAVPVQP
ncbi:hypothetical protein RB595_004758 [Gaeumannomyces hyphopodioides]